MQIVSCVLSLVLAGVASTFAQANPDWTEPFPPFHIAGNLYYVGSKGLANYLVTTPQGNILINSDLEANVAIIQASIEKLGFKFNDTKILLISHAHWDHDSVRPATDCRERHYLLIRNRSELPVECDAGCGVRVGT